MGMAASQARYLALTARKTNTEWEGQQINQARTALANQSANLFNRLLNMEVPNPPKETDYVKYQYSYSDGDNESVIEKWDKLSTRNGDYNYAVTHYYMADVFTGATKQLQDPQVQIGDVLKKLEYDPNTTTVDISGNDIKVTYKINNYDYEQTYNKIDDAGDDNKKKALYNFEKELDMLDKNGNLTFDNVYGYEDNGVWHFFAAAKYDKVNDAEAGSKKEEALRKFEAENNLLKEQLVLNYDTVYGTQDSTSGKWQFVNKVESNHITTDKAQADPNLKAALDAAGYWDKVQQKVTSENIYGQQDTNGNWFVLDTNESNKITQQKADTDPNLKSALTTYEVLNNLAHEEEVLTFDGIYGYADSNGDWHFTVNNKKDNDSFMKPYNYIDYSTVSNEPAFVGNSKLTELTKLIEDKDKGIMQVSELAQILRDSPNDNLRKYLSFDSEGNLVYTGNGIYTFDINGKTYYTTKDDLLNSYNTPTKDINGIDQQSKLNYYNAAYISKKIKETNQALLETDGNGRFTSVRFDNDSITYNLDVEQVKNEAAYQDAMNKYLYDKAQYEKTIADINAKTSIIQKEDRTLELRLKQLDTEQNALATEMDAVKKVIKDNVEKTFKTFSD